MGNPNSVTCSRVTRDPIVFDTARNGEPQFADGLNAWEMKLRSDASTEHDGSTTTNITHPNLNTAEDLLFKRHAAFQQLPKTTWRQPRSQHHLLEVV